MINKKDNSKDNDHNNGKRLLLLWLIEKLPMLNFIIAVRKFSKYTSFAFNKLT